MSAPEVDDLRAQLRERGYLSHGIERWFALDPWRSRAFWVELVSVAGKGAALIGLFAVVPLVAVMLFRNHPLSAFETLLMSLLYGVTAVLVSFLFLIGVALLLRLRPTLAVDTPRALLAISIAAAAILAAPLAAWWYRFDAPPSASELVAGLLLIALFFVVSTIVVSAALLSFSIYELRRIPALHQKPRGVPMTVAAAVLIALLFIPAYATQEKRAPGAPLQVVTTPTNRRVALVAVDGLTWEILRSRPALVAAFAAAHPVPRPPGESTAERWATIGTGVPGDLHGVRAIEGIRFRGGTHVLQALSRADFVLHDLAGAIGVAQRQPLPPAVRRRDYVWEIFAARGVPSVAVNWWTSETKRDGALDSVGQETIFAAAKRDAVAVDEAASARLLSALDKEQPRVATVYLPALDIILNRLALDPSARLASSVRVLDGVAAVVTALRVRGYDVLLAGVPGDGQTGQAVVASTFSLPAATTVDLAPTLCAIEGFPASEEMPGRALTGEATRIDSYGARSAVLSSTRVNDEYFQSLRSLGYIR